ncbi:MAG: trimethylamine methyltransferase family protein [Anaerolineales bacterium]|uniref:Trimethylamine methyltransferase family protein n=1 Tax=Candidatus Desulfolinea nitratireducens TaxID=2841698 RepID=A0A8J6NHF8_9CHLR|nr:trimethylamine methyltransferase family protein [Candidatus Desulfolinea nitratireducens]MBL6961784.1 trimethylamine methyltransferase family protein [Anaerolineales bacterium]
MTSKTLKPYLKYLSDSHIEEIHDGSLDLLENTGIMVDHQEGLEFLEKHGAKVDFQTKRARIPRQLVRRALETVPDRFTLAARNPEKDCPLIPGGRPYSRNGGGADFTIDLETGEFRPLLHADVKDYYKLMDALDGISFIAPVFGQDMPVLGRDILMLREAFGHTDKHIHLRAFTGESLKLMFEMAVIVAGGKKELKERPIVSLLEAPISPLKFLDVTVDALWLCGEYGIPLDVCVMPIAGGTGPMTMAGNIQLLNTEFLAGVVISQLANPGAPLQYAPRPMAMDMRTGFSLAGSVELGIMATAGAQMAHFYKVPVSLHGPWSDSMTHDGQSILERMYMNMMAALAGANVLVGAGMMQQSLVISHEQLVIDSEINHIAFRSVEGFEVNAERLAREVIDRVGPGGNFVADPHTYKFLRGERFEPTLQYRNSREAWEETGSKTMVDRAKEKALAILEEHQPNPLPEDIRKELDEFVPKALKSLEK